MNDAYHLAQKRKEERLELAIQRNFAVSTLIGAASLVGLLNDLGITRDEVEIDLAYVKPGDLLITQSQPSGNIKELINNGKLVISFDNYCEFSRKKGSSHDYILDRFNKTELLDGTAALYFYGLFSVDELKKGIELPKEPGITSHYAHSHHACIVGHTRNDINHILNPNKRVLTFILKHEKLDDYAFNQSQIYGHKKISSYSEF